MSDSELCFQLPNNLEHATKRLLLCYNVNVTNKILFFITSEIYYGVIGYWPVGGVSSQSAVNSLKGRNCGIADQKVMSLGTIVPLLDS